MYLLPIDGVVARPLNRWSGVVRYDIVLHFAHIRLYLQKCRPLKRKQHFYGVTILISFDSS
jgi:hypothetical protein